MPTIDDIALQRTHTCFHYKQIPVVAFATFILSTCCTPVQAFASSQISMAPAATAFLTQKVPYYLLEATDTFQDVADIFHDGKRLAKSESLLSLDHSHSLAINVGDILIDVVIRIFPTNLSAKVAQVAVRVLSLGDLHLQDPSVQHPEQFILQAMLLLAITKELSDASGTWSLTASNDLLSEHAVTFATTKDWTDATFAAATSDSVPFQIFF